MIRIFWKNVYNKNYFMTGYFNNEEEADENHEKNEEHYGDRTHYIKYYWKDFVLQSVELIPINND